MSRIIDYTEATSPVSDDYLVIDGSTNGTRKIKPENIITTDPTGTRSGVPADAKATEDKIEGVKSEISDAVGVIDSIEKNTRISQSYAFVNDGYVNSEGTFNYTTSAKNTGFVSLTGLKSISYKVNLSSSAYGLAFFDSDKNFVQSISIAGGTSAELITVNVTTEILQLATCFVVSHYYKSSITWDPECSVSASDDTFGARITGLETEVLSAVKTDDIEAYIGLNKFNTSDVLIGKEVYSDGSLRDNSSSVASGFIAVHDKQFVYLKNLPTYSTSEMNRLSFFYDENKEKIGSYTAISRTASTAIIEIPTNAYYFRFSIYQRVQNETLPLDYSMVMVTTEATDIAFEPYTQYVSEIKGYKIPKDNSGSDVSGLKVVIFGDSITETASMNDDGTNYVEGYRHNWPEYVNNYMQWASFKNYAKSGASYKNRGSGYEYRQTVANQIALAIADSNNDDADLVIFSLGTNDDTANLGSYETAMSKTSLADLDQTKLYEALRYAYWTVRSKYKNAICFSAIPIQRADIEPPEELYEAITKMAHRYGFIVINGAYQSGIIKENNVWEQEGNDLYDGLHPNTTGQVKIAKLYTSVITSHLLYK